MDLIVAHAPRGGHDADVRSTRWSDLTGLLRKVHDTDRQAVLMIDANARVSEPYEEVCGDYQLERCDVNSAPFVGALAAGKPMLPATFPRMAEPHDHRTWLSNADKWHRIDYVAVPQA